MVNRVQTARSSVSHNRPAVGSRQVGELYINFADFQLGMIDVSQSPQDLVAVRYFSVNANYVAGAWCVTPDGNIATAKAAITAGAYNASQWSPLVLASAIGTGYLPLTGGTLIGPLNGTTYVFSGSGTVTGGLNVNPTSGGANLSLFAPAGTYRTISFENGNTSSYTNRWVMFADNNAETGSNAGSNFGLNAYGDTGTYIGQAFSFNRASLAASFGGQVNVTSTMGCINTLSISEAAVNSNAFVGFFEPGFSPRKGYVGLVSENILLTSDTGGANITLSGTANQCNINASSTYTNYLQVQNAQLRVTGNDIVCDRNVYIGYASNNGSYIGYAVHQYSAGWYWSWNTSTGTLTWVGNNASRWSIDGSGNTNTTGSSTISGNLTVSGSIAATNGNVTAGNVLIANSANGVGYPAISGYYIGWGWNAGLNTGGLYVYVNAGQNWYVPHGYAVSGATENIVSWSYNTNGNMYASVTDGSQRTWSTVSSARQLKSNIAKSTYDALRAIKALNIVSCDMKFSPRDDAQSYHWDCALIADEVEPVIPMAYVAPVTYKGRGDIEGEPPAEEQTSLETLRELPLITTLIKAVQQLTERLEAAEATLATLRSL